MRPCLSLDMPARRTHSSLYSRRENAPQSPFVKRVMHITRNLFFPAVWKPRGWRQPTPPLARHPSQEGRRVVPLLGGVAEGRGGFLFASHVLKGGSAKRRGISGQENAPPGKKCKRRHSPILGLVVLLSVAHPAGADPPASRGAALASACAACHGPDGHGRGAIPGLDGLSPEALRRAMYDFRAEKRPATVMHYIAAGLAPADIEAVVAHFGREGES